jgi:hypothetical protein
MSFNQMFVEDIENMLRPFEREANDINLRLSLVYKVYKLMDIDASISFAPYYMLGIFDPLRLLEQQVHEMI